MHDTPPIVLESTTACYRDQTAGSFLYPNTRNVATIRRYNKMLTKFIRLYLIDLF